MRTIDADALSTFVGDLRSALHKEQSKFKGMTDIEFNTRDYMLLNFQYAIDNAPTVDTTCPNCDSGYAQGYSDGYLKGKEERPQGEWIEGYHGHFETLDCSLCGYVRDNRYATSNFCPNCGADMRGEKEVQKNESDHNNIDNMRNIGDDLMD